MSKEFEAAGNTFGLSLEDFERSAVAGGILKSER
jgi:hypothetical protein